MRFQNVIEVNARIIDVESASIIAAESVKDTTAIGLEKLVFSMAEKIIKDFPLEGYIVHRAKNVVSIDLGKRFGVKRKMQFVTFIQGDVIKHPTTGEILDVETIETGVIEIIKVGSKISKAIIIKEQSPNAIVYGQRVKSMGEYEPSFTAATQKISPPKTEPVQTAVPTKTEPVQTVVSVRSKPKVIGRDMGRYTAYDNGIVKDERAGLEWIAGPDRDTTWKEAKNWVASLTFDGGGWRMPTMRELKKLYVERWGSRNMTRLIKTKGWYVWSGDSRDKGFDFSLSHEDWEYGGDDSSFRTRGFAVRSEKHEPSFAAATQKVSPPKTEPPQPVAPRTSASGIRTAIFPWKFGGTGKTYLLYTRDVLQKIILKDRLFVPLFSYYDLGDKVQRKFKVNGFSEEILPDNVVKNLWIKKGFSGWTPNVDLVCTLGRQLQVDAILMYYIDVTAADPDKGTSVGFLIDVNTQKIYRAKSRTESYEEEGERMNYKLTQKVFKAYNR